MNWVKKLLHFALLHFVSKSCYNLSQKVVTFRVKKLLHFASKVVTFRVDVTFCINCYILQCNSTILNLVTWAKSVVTGLLVHKMLQALCKWIAFDRVAAKQQKKTKKTS